MTRVTILEPSVSGPLNPSNRCCRGPFLTPKFVSFVNGTIKLRITGVKMWCLVPYLTVGLITVLTGLLSVFFLCPSLLVRFYFLFWRTWCGMQVKFIGDKDYVFCYGERGQKSKDRSSILFIHGFTSSKDQWDSAFKSSFCLQNLPKEYHLIAVDMPGHGATTTPPLSQELHLDFSMEIIKKFVDLVELTDKPFHLIGASLGGSLAGLFSAKYPELVERVTLICPAMRCPEACDFSNQVERAVQIGTENIELKHCSLLPQTPQELQRMLDSCIYTRLKLNNQFLKGFLGLRRPKNSFFLRVFKAVATEENMTLLEEICHKITIPSQIIWGAHDQIVHPSGAKVLANKMPNCCDVTILENCGHAVDVDRPYATCKAIVRFRGDTKPEKK